MIAVKSQWHTVATQQLAQQAEIAESGFGGEELRGEDFTCGVVLHAQSSELRPAAFEPVVQAAVKLQEFAKPSGTQAALAMSGSPAFSRRADPVLAQQAAKSFATEGKALALDQLLAEMVVIEAGIFAARQLHQLLAHGVGQATVAGSPAVGVCQSRLPGFAHPFLQAFNLPHAQTQKYGGSATRHVPLDACADHAHSLQFLLIQRECLLAHGVTFSRCC